MQHLPQGGDQSLGRNMASLSLSSGIRGETSNGERAMEKKEEEVERRASMENGRSSSSSVLRPSGELEKTNTARKLGVAWHKS